MSGIKFGLDVFFPSLFSWKMAEFSFMGSLGIGGQPTQNGRARVAGWYFWVAQYVRRSHTKNGEILLRGFRVWHGMSTAPISTLILLIVSITNSSIVCALQCKIDIDMNLMNMKFWKMIHSSVPIGCGYPRYAKCNKIYDGKITAVFLLPTWENDSNNISEVSTPFRQNYHPYLLWLFGVHASNR